MKGKIGFYRPHKRITQDNLMLDKKTGELVAMPSMTKQSFRDQCDINNILKQYKTPQMVALLQAQAAQGRYADLPDPMDLQESMNIVLEAESAFASLPAKIRNRFANDPGQFLEFMHDPANTEEIYKLGLAEKPKAVDPLEVKVVNPPQSPAEPSGREAPPSTAAPPDRA